MAELISEIWAGLRDSGLPEVMLFLADNSASRCHWDDTAEVGSIRVALLADQERQIVRIVPVDSCIGIGVASPKGVDPSGYKLFIQNKLRKTNGEPEPAPVAEAPPAPAPAPPPAPEPAPAAEPAPAVRPDPLTSRWGSGLRPQGAGARVGAGSAGFR